MQRLKILFLYTATDWTNLLTGEILSDDYYDKLTLFIQLWNNYSLFYNKQGQQIVSVTLDYQYLSLAPIV